MSSLGTLIVFLSFFTHGVAFRQCIDEHQQTIAASAEGAARNFDVPVQLLLVQGFLESHWGCDPRSNGSWGSQIENGGRHTDDGPRRAARDLAHSYQFCGTWEGAISRFVFGECHIPPRPRNAIFTRYVADALSYVRRLEDSAEAHAGEFRDDIRRSRITPSGLGEAPGTPATQEDAP